MIARDIPKLPPTPAAIRSYFEQRFFVVLANAPWDDEEAWQAALTGGRYIPPSPPLEPDKSEPTYRSCRLCDVDFRVRHADQVHCSRRCAAVEADGEPTAAERHTLDDPFRNIKLGAVGQITNCRSCGLTFESRGLRICTNCREAGEDRPTVAGRSLQTRACEACGSPMPVFGPSGKRLPTSARFCGSRCRTRAARVTANHPGRPIPHPTQLVVTNTPPTPAPADPRAVEQGNA